MRKIIKNIVLILDLAILITLLVLNLTAKQALDEILVESVKSLVPENITEKAEKGSDWFQEIANNDIFKEYIGEDQKEKLTKKWDSMKEELGEYIEEYIENQEEKLDPKQQKLIKVVRFLTTTKLKYYILAAIGLTIIMMMINLRSVYKWIKSSSWSIAMSGIILLGICYYVKKLIVSFVPTDNITLRIIQTPAVYLILGGVIIRFIYGVCEIIIKTNKKSKREDEESEVS